MFPPLPRVMISCGFNISSCSIPFGLSFLSFFHAALFFCCCCFLSLPLSPFWVNRCIDFIWAIKANNNNGFFCLRFFWNFVFKIYFSDFFFMNKNLSQISCEVDSGHIHGTENGSLPGITLHFFLPACLADVLGRKAFPSTVCCELVAPKDCFFASS